MSIDFTNQNGLLALSEAPKHVPPQNGKRTHPSTFWRWCRKGIRAGNGEVIRLEHVRVGGKIYTSIEAINQFVNALAAADLEAFGDRPEPAPKTAAPKTRSARRREREIQQANDVLRRAGIITDD